MKQTVASIALAAIVLSTLGACEDPEVPPVELEESADIYPEVIQTGFTGGSGETFKVRVQSSMTGAVTWTAADPSVVDIVTYADHGTGGYVAAMVTTKKAGTTKIFATKGTMKAEATVHVKAYTSASLAIGRTRYEKGETGARRPCGSCHGGEEGNVAHSLNPSFITRDDRAILTAIQTGTYASDGTSDLLNEGNHKWNLTDAEKSGIVAYLRGIAPYVQKL